MKKYEVLFRVEGHLEVEAKDEDEAERIAMDSSNSEILDGVNEGLTYSTIDVSDVEEIKE